MSPRLSTSEPGRSGASYSLRKKRVGEPPIKQEIAWSSPLVLLRYASIEEVGY